MTLALRKSGPARAAVHVRAATADDLDQLLRIEEASFEQDRLSRRSFKHLLSSPSATCLIAETSGRPIGYALVLRRATTALARLYSIAILAEARGLGAGRALLEAAETAAYDHGCIFLRLEVREDNISAISLYESAGYRRFGKHLDYYADHASALRYEKRLAPPGREPGRVPFYEQTTDFTCGPACMIMALLWAKTDVTPGPRLELRLWREATTIFMAAGHGGCEPLGLAVTLARHGLEPEIHVSRPGPYFLDGVRSAAKRRAMTATQEDFALEAKAAGVPVRLEPLTLSRLLSALDEGAIVIVLVSGYRMFAKKAPHWVLAHGHDGRHLFVNDPWVEDLAYETPSAAANLPIPFAEFQKMAKYGKDALRAAVVVKKGASK